jgi:hypothetical protein
MLGSSKAAVEAAEAVGDAQRGADVERGDAVRMDEDPGPPEAARAQRVNRLETVRGTAVPFHRAAAPSNRMARLLGRGILLPPNARTQPPAEPSVASRGR